MSTTTPSSRGQRRPGSSPEPDERPAGRARSSARRARAVPGRGRSPAAVRVVWPSPWSTPRSVGRRRLRVRRGSVPSRRRSTVHGYRRRTPTARGRSVRRTTAAPPGGTRLRSRLPGGSSPVSHRFVPFRPSARRASPTVASSSSCQRRSARAVRTPRRRGSRDPATRLRPCRRTPCGAPLSRPPHLSCAGLPQRDG